MSALVTNPAPDFTAPAVLPDNSIGEFKLADQKGRYTLLLFYPLDFSPVCPAEIMAFNARVAEFTERGCDIIGISSWSLVSLHGPSMLGALTAPYRPPNRVGPWWPAPEGGGS